MLRNRMFALVFIVAAMMIVSACAIPTSLFPPAGSTTEITFDITIEPEIFSPDATITVFVWNEEQMEISSQTSDCSVSYNADTGEETTDCPEGVEFQEANPKQFSFPASTIGDSLTITSRTLRMGEKYMLQVSGLGSDNCNQTSAGVEGTVKSKTITVKDLQWMSTMMACP